jgi:hypothetical protein
MPISFLSPTSAAQWQALCDSDLLTPTGFRPVDDAAADDLASAAGLAGEPVRALAKMRSGSWLGLWIDGEHERFVWIDSEGEPSESIAKDPAAFFALVGHGEGAIYDRLQFAIREADGAHRTMGWTDDMLRARVAELDAESAKTARKLASWKAKVGIEVTAKPLSILGEALSTARFSRRARSAG